jgi:hypothetical protein
VDKLSHPNFNKLKFTFTKYNKSQYVPSLKNVVYEKASSTADLHEPKDETAETL